MAVIEGTRRIAEGLGLAEGAIKWARGDYAFAADGGAVGDITLAADVIPSGAYILGGFLEVTTAPTSGGAATVAIKIESAADFNAADAISGAPWSTTGVKQPDHLWTSAPIKTTAKRGIVATVGTAALTGGVFKVFVAYVEAG